jgi:tetratricopeptide (TPR) repeat protein
LYPGALADLAFVIERFPTDTRSYLLRANIYEEIGETDLAIADYLQILEYELDFFVRVFAEERLAALGVEPYATGATPTAAP